MIPFFSKIKQIIEGWILFLTDDKETRALRDERMKKCKPCRFRKGHFCGECGCLLEAKTRLYEAECPFEFWTAKSKPNETKKPI